MNEIGKDGTQALLPGGAVRKNAIKLNAINLGVNV
jgi:hypothetical protein